MNHKRDKLIRIRISEDEFRAINQVCEQSGLTDIGALTLQTMQEMVGAPAPSASEQPSSHLWVKELIARLQSLQAEVERLEVLLNVDPAKH